MDVKLTPNHPLTIASFSDSAGSYRAVPYVSVDGCTCVPVMFPQLLDTFEIHLKTPAGAMWVLLKASEAKVKELVYLPPDENPVLNPGGRTLKSVLAESRDAPVTRSESGGAGPEKVATEAEAEVEAEVVVAVAVVGEEVSETELPVVDEKEEAVSKMELSAVDEKEEVVSSRLVRRHSWRRRPLTRGKQTGASRTRGAGDFHVQLAHGARLDWRRTRGYPTAETQEEEEEFKVEGGGGGGCTGRAEQRIGKSD
jgi:hypothetical protein